MSALLEAPDRPTAEDVKREKLRRYLEADWSRWLRFLFGSHVSRGFAEHHAEYWSWLWEIEPDSDPAPFVGIWPRGGGKSSSAELGAVALGLRGKRSYIIYLRDTQDRADDSVGNCAALLESESVAYLYPEHSERAVGKFGDSKGWRRNRVRTAGGLTIDALGLDTAARGIKLEGQRPDAIWIDDVDGRHDSARATERKIATITDSLLPAGVSNLAALFIQNLIIPNGIASKLADGRADFLSGRTISGPHPAVRNLATEKRTRPDGSLRDVIVGGVASWAGQSLEACQRLIDRLGLSAFTRECQHQVQEREGALLTRDDFAETRVGSHPPLVRVVVGVDPPGGKTEAGIVAAGKGHNGHAYVVADHSQPGQLGPNNWARAAVDLYHELEADVIVAERNFGGDMVMNTIKTVDPSVNVELVNASRGKQVRAEPVASLFRERRAHHVGSMPECETEWTSWAPGDPDSPNRVDAETWAISKLMFEAPLRRTVRVIR